MGFIYSRRNWILRPLVRVQSVIVLLTILLCATGTGEAEDTVSKTVAASPLRELAVYPEYTAPASVIALNDSELRSEVSAVVQDIAVEVGQVVNKNDVLVRLQRRDFQLAVQREQAELDILQARIEFAQYQVQRAQTLKQQEAVPEELLKQRETDLAVLLSQKQSKQIALQQAEHNLSKCDIRAPFNAVISKKLVSIGELASPGTPLLQVVDAQRREVTAKLQSYQIVSLRTASQLYFQNRQHQYPLTLRSVLPVLDPKERTREVRLLFANAKALAGSAGELVWKNNDVHVPAELLVQRKNRLGVFVVNGKKTRFIALDNAAEGRPARVELPLDTMIVTKGRFRLQDGDTVSVM